LPESGVAVKSPIGTPEALLKVAIGLLLVVASLIKAPALIAPYSGSSIVTSKDKNVGWTADWGMEPTSVQDQKAVRFTEKGKGRLSTFPQEVEWSIVAVWLAGDTFLPLDFEKTVTSIDGRPLLIERKHFNHDKRTVRFETIKAGRSPETKTLEIPEDTLTVEGLAGVLRFATFDQSRPLSAHLLNNEPRVYDVTFELRGKERVKTPAGEFECYKVEMVPHVGVLNLFRPLLPKAFFWFTVPVPHDWIRYEGPESAPGTPNIVMELSR
jgi:hypothetical protein